MNEELNAAAAVPPEESASMGPAAEVPALQAEAGEAAPAIPAVPAEAEEAAPAVPAVQAAAEEAVPAAVPAVQAAAGEAVPAAAPAVPAEPDRYTAPAAPQAPIYQPAYQNQAYQNQAYQPPVNPGPYPQQPAQPAYPYATRETPRSTEPRPGRKSPYAPMNSAGIALQLFLMNIPVLGLILSIIWACGVCRKITRRNLARAHLILLIISVILIVAGALVLRFCFPEELTRAFEQAFPGYTIQWG